MYMPTYKVPLDLRILIFERVMGSSKVSKLIPLKISGYIIIVQNICDQEIDFSHLKICAVTFQKYPMM